MVLEERAAVLGDLFIEGSLTFATDTAKVRNNTGSEVELNQENVLGMPVIAGTDAGAEYNLAVAGQEASVTGIILDVEPDGETIAATTNGTKKYQVINRGAGVILNQDKLAVNDIAGAAFNQTTLRTRLVALGFKLKHEPLATETLTPE